MCHIKNLQVIQQAEGTEPSSQDDVYWFRALVMKTLAQGHRINSSWDFVLNYPKQPFDTGIPFEHSSSWESQGSPKNETDAKRQKVSEH